MVKTTQRYVDSENAQQIEASESTESLLPVTTENLPQKKPVTTNKENPGQVPKQCI